MTQLIQQFCRVFGLMQGCGILRKGRNMKKRNWFLTGACTLASAAMMSAAVFGASYTPGTYEASAAGRNGDVKVEVTFTEDAIESVNVTEHAETDGIGTTAVETLPGAIVDNQSLGVDVVAGATITSEAILAAAADCVTQAGGDAEALKAAAVEEKEPELQEELDADLVIIGGGGAGMTAAVRAGQLGLDVVLLEKMPFMGGAISISGGNQVVMGSRMQQDLGVTDDSVESMV